MKALLDVFNERQRQIDAEGWTPEHDDKHDKGELAADRACWAIYWATVAGIVIYLAVTTFWKGV
ncbi:hypothetical protein [Salinicola salarius]|uniref:hypothetical protein n=1 Tax=Salinicola salarius TaxID=430457 RepID=UPI000DA1529F|nr:hypothetical protein [Salinicola salarius]